MTHSSLPAGSGGVTPKFAELTSLYDPRGLLLFCGAVILALAMLSLFAVALNGPEMVDTSVRLDQPKLIFLQAFYMDREASLPTFVNYSLLVLASGLIFLVARLAFYYGNAWRFHWLLLGFIFVFLSFDEAAQMHEKLVQPVRNTLNTTGIFHFAWIIPGLAFVAVVGVTFMNFLRALPDRIGLLICVAGAIYVGGAIGVEAVGGLTVTTGDRQSWAYVLAVTVEETLEMLGITVFCAALLQMISSGLHLQHGYFSGDDS